MDEKIKLDQILIEFRQVFKSFGVKEVLCGLDLSVRRGETITIMGGSGTGKSVLLKLLVGLLKPEAGSILVEDRNIVPMAEEELNKVRMKFGMVFQSSALFDSLTVMENVAYPLKLAGELLLHKIEEKVAWSLEMVGMAGTEGLLPEELSGGMKKRVALARAIVRNPNIILYDEPTTGLDPANVNKILELILTLQKNISGLTSIVVTHDIESAFKVSNRLALLAQGRIVAVGTKEELLGSHQEAVENFLEGRENKQ